jgi:hypothetical protein
MCVAHVAGARNVGTQKRRMFSGWDETPCRACCNTMHGILAPLTYRAAGPVSQDAANAHARGSKFLKAWMEHLEESADLRYPNLADVYVDEQDG